MERDLRVGGRRSERGVLPEDERAARYVDRFERLRDPSHNRAFSHTEWKSMFEEAGLIVMQTQVITKRHLLLPWAERQGCSAEVIDQLTRKLVEAPSIAAGWLQVRDPGTSVASFVNHHILIAGMTLVDSV